MIDFREKSNSTAQEQYFFYRFSTELEYVSSGIVGQDDE